MTIASEMKEAVATFEKERPDWCSIAQTSHPIYAIVKISGWPFVVHYEFRFNQKDGLFVELHVEHKNFASLGETLASCSKRTPTIDGYKLIYSGEHNPPKAGQKRWPSLSISLGHNVPGTKSASIMKKLIDETRATIASAIGHWSSR